MTKGVSLRVESGQSVLVNLLFCFALTLQVLSTLALNDSLCHTNHCHVCSALDSCIVTHPLMGFEQGWTVGGTHTLTANLFCRDEASIPTVFWCLRIVNHKTCSDWELTALFGVAVSTWRSPQCQQHTTSGLFLLLSSQFHLHSHCLKAFPAFGTVHAFRGQPAWQSLQFQDHPHQLLDHGDCLLIEGRMA